MAHWEFKFSEFKLGVSGIAGLVLAPGGAQANRLIPTSQRTSYAAYDYDVPLRIVSLAGSVPAEWVADFKQALQVFLPSSVCRADSAFKGVGVALL